MAETAAQSQEALQQERKRRFNLLWLNIIRLSEQLAVQSGEALR